jgi:hypothetical protein
MSDSLIVEDGDVTEFFGVIIRQSMEVKLFILRTDFSQILSPAGSRIFALQEFLLCLKDKTATAWLFRKQVPWQLW